MPDRRSFTSFFTGENAPASAREKVIFSATGGGVLTFGQYARLNVSAGYTSYAGPPAAGDGNAISMPVAGTWKLAIVDTANAAPAGTWTFTLNVNGTNSTLVLTIGSGLKHATYTGAAIATVAGDYVVWKIGGAVTGITSNISISIEFTPDQ